MKKIIALSALLALGALGVACGGSDNATNSNRSNANNGNRNANNGPYSNGPLNNTSVGNGMNTATNLGVNAVKKVDNAVAGNSKTNTNANKTKK